MSSFALKIIALATMIIDHTGAVFSTDTPYILRCIGRAAFPIYVFLISEGCKYTKNIWKLSFNMACFALVSQVPFDLCFNRTRSGINISFVNDTNVFYTLTLAVLAVADYQILKQWIDGRENNISNPFLRWLYDVFCYIPAFLPALGCMYLADYLQTDYGSFGVLWIFVMYLCGNKSLKVICAFLGVMHRYGSSVFELFCRAVVNFDFGYFARMHTLMRYDYLRLGFALAAVALLALYNGKRGRNLKFVFYAAYPVHLFILGILRQIIK